MFNPKCKKKLRVNKVAVIILIIISCAMASYYAPKIDKNYIFGVTTDSLKNTENYIEGISDRIDEVDIYGQLKVHFIDVGQADSILVEQAGKYMLIDGGNDEDGKLVVGYLKLVGVNKLDYIVATHADEDHIGGLDDVINNFDVGRIYFPSQEKSTLNYRDFKYSVVNNNLSFTYPELGSSFLLGDANCTILSPGQGQFSRSNDYSIVIRLVFGKNSFIFMADANNSVEDKILDRFSNIDSDVIKIGHHGSNDATDMDFLSAVKPEYAVITSGRNNEYGNPSRVVLDKLNYLGILVYRTDERGTIIAISDGNQITFNKSNSNY